MQTSSSRACSARTIDDLHDTDFLIDAATTLGSPVSDYVMCRTAPPGVFLIATSEEANDLGDHPATAKLRTTRRGGYILVKAHHLCGLEIPGTLLDVAEGKPPLMTNSARPRIGVAAVAKRTAKPGTAVANALGSFEFRGSAVRIVDEPDHLPICLLRNARVRRKVEPGEVVRFDDVELPESRALSIYLSLRDQAIKSRSSRTASLEAPVPLNGHIPNSPKRLAAKSAVASSVQFSTAKRRPPSASS